MHFAVCFVVIPAAAYFATFVPLFGWWSLTFFLAQAFASPRGSERGPRVVYGELRVTRVRDCDAPRTLQLYRELWASKVVPA